MLDAWMIQPHATATQATARLFAAVSVLLGEMTPVDRVRSVPDLECDLADDYCSSEGRSVPPTRPPRRSVAALPLGGGWWLLLAVWMTRRRRCWARPRSHPARCRFGRCLAAAGHISRITVESAAGHERRRSADRLCRDLLERGFAGALSVANRLAPLGKLWSAPCSVYRIKQVSSPLRGSSPRG